MPISWRLHTSKNLRVRMCKEQVFEGGSTNRFALTFFLLANANFAIFAKDAPMIPINHI